MGHWLDTIKVVRSGKVRRAKLYYLRDRTGKSARIAEKIKRKIGIDIGTKIQQVTEENVMPTSEEKTEESPKTESKAEAPKVESKTAQKSAPKKEEKKQVQPKENPEQKK